MDERVLIYIDKQRFIPVFLWSVLSGGAQLRVFFFIFVFNFIVDVLTTLYMYYSSLNNL